MLVPLILLLVSCASRRVEQVSLPADFKGPKALERLYGVKITENDNIFLYNEGARWLGVPHRLGGMSKQGVDCSGLTMQIYKAVYRKKISRSAAEMLKKDCKRIGRGQLHEGDLVFFRTGGGKRNTPNHVGVYSYKRIKGCRGKQFERALLYADLDLRGTSGPMNKK